MGRDVTLDNVTVSGNDQGPGITVQGADLTIRNSSIRENTNLTGGGGGISALLGSTTTIENSTISGNEALYGGGIYAAHFDEAGDEAVVDVINSTISSNIAGIRGGGVYLRGAEATLKNATIANNTGEGGGVFANRYVDLEVHGYLRADNTVIAGNQLNSYTPDDLGGNLNFDSTSSHNLIGTPTNGDQANGTRS